MGTVMLKVKKNWWIRRRKDGTNTMTDSWSNTSSFKSGFTGPLPPVGAILIENQTFWADDGPPRYRAWEVVGHIMWTIPIGGRTRSASTAWYVDVKFAGVVESLSDERVYGI